MERYKRYKRFFEDDYRMSHQAPDKKGGCPLYDVTLNGIYPDDVYGNNAVSYYGAGESYDREAINIIQSAKDKPNKSVKIYRAVPDLNHALDKENKELTKIFNFYFKFKFFNSSHPIVDEIEKTFKAKRKRDETVTEFIHGALSKRSDEIAKSRKQNPSINIGDWVTISRKYAVDHGHRSLKGEFKIISKAVKAKELYTNGDSIHEWGYYK